MPSMESRMSSISSSPSFELLELFTHGLFLLRRVQEAQPPQKKNFDANCIRRGLVPGSVLVTTPKLALLLVQQLVLGGANCARFNRLKNSTLNSKPMRSCWPSNTLLNPARSKLSTPSERKVESTRGSVPNVKSAGAAKHAALNQPRSRRLLLAGVELLQEDSRLGREPAPNRVTSFTWPLLNTSGNPL